MQKCMIAWIIVTEKKRIPARRIRLQTTFSKKIWFKKKLCGKKALTSPFPKEIENLKIPKINFTSTFGKKLEVEKTNFPNKI